MADVEALHPRRAGSPSGDSTPSASISARVLACCEPSSPAVVPAPAGRSPRHLQQCRRCPCGWRSTCSRSPVARIIGASSSASRSALTISTGGATSRVVLRDEGVDTSGALASSPVGQGRKAGRRGGGHAHHCQVDAGLALLDDDRDDVGVGVASGGFHRCWCSTRTGFPAGRARPPLPRSAIPRQLLHPGFELGRHFARPARRKRTARSTSPA